MAAEPNVVSDLPIMQLQSVSPDARWAIVGVTPPNGHGDTNSVMMAVPLEGGAPPPYVTTAASDSALHVRRHPCSHGVWTGSGCTYLSGNFPSAH